MVEGRKMFLILFLKRLTESENVIKLNLNNVYVWCFCLKKGRNMNYRGICNIISLF